MAAWELAQLNVARLLAPLESPLLAGFVGNLERINALADASPGFRWRLVESDGNATALRPFGDDLLVNLSVWADLDSLRAFAFASDHAGIMRRRAEWFSRLDEAYVVLWWIPAGHRPTIEEAHERLQRLRRDGPGPQAFGFRHPQPPPAG